MSKESLRILLVEDSEDDSILTRRELHRGGIEASVRVVASLAEVRQALAGETWDAVLTDYRLPGFDALDVIAAVRARDQGLPVIVLSATVGEEVAVETLRGGANDYVLKYNLARLVPALRRELDQARARRASQAALAGSESRLAMVLQQLPVVLWTTDPGLLVTSPTGSIFGGMGSAPWLCPGEPVTRRFPAPHGEASVEALHGSALRGEETTFAFTWEGQRYEAWVRPLRGPDGSIEGTLGMALDVTGRRQLEDRFQAAQRMEAVGRLAGGVAHDFNNLLSVVSGCASLLGETIGPESEGQGDLEQIHRAVARGADLVRQLLAFSRRQMLAPRVLDLAQSLREVQSLLQRAIGEDILLKFRIEEGLGAVRVDPTQVEQILMNLAINARDAMPEGGSLTIEARNVVLGEDYRTALKGRLQGPAVKLAVSDTGCGMEAAVRERIFEPFFTTKDEGRGTGLGLSTVYGIVKQSGGDIWVYSEPGKGTSFHIYLPRADAPPDPVPTPVVRDALPVPGGDETILVVEDEPDLLALAVRVLSQRGYRVLSAGNGKAALETAAAHEGGIALMVSDIVLPGMRGSEIAARLGALRPGIRVLFMSGYTEDAIVHRGELEAGIHFLPKPFSPRALAQKVREVLDAREEPAG